jgi:hypothetical protein
MRIGEVIVSSKMSRSKTPNQPSPEGATRRHRAGEERVTTTISNGPTKEDK